MPVYDIRCRECQHSYPAMVMAGAHMPVKWTCSSCGSDDAAEPSGVVFEDPFAARGATFCGCGCG